MAKKWSNQNLPGALHFVTGVVIDRVEIFRRSDCCEIFLRECQALAERWPCKLIAYVVMPDHFHLVVNPRDGNIQGFVGALKSLSARAIVRLTGDTRFIRDGDESVNQVWQDSFKVCPCGVHG